jgi:hypothetical protein
MLVASISVMNQRVAKILSNLTMHGVGVKMDSPVGKRYMESI